MTLALRRWAVDTSVTPVQAPPASPDRSLPLTLIGSGFATFMAGAAVGMIGVLEASDAPTSDGVEARHARSKALIGDVVGGTGIAVLGVGVILLLTQGGSKAPKPSASAVSLFAEGSASGVRVTF